MSLSNSRRLTIWMVWIMVFLPSIFGILGSLHSVPIHINAWDEEIYLSFLGAPNIAFEVGFGSYWIAGRIVYFLHNIGLDGSKINAIFDFLTILITSIFMIRYCALKQVEAIIVPALTAILLYIVCALNYANPLLLNLGVFNIDSIITSGKETYSFFLRTPNPQFTILMILVQYLLLNTNQTGKKIAGLLLTPVILFFGYIFILPGYTVMFLVLGKRLVPKIKSSYYYLIALSLILFMCLVLGYGAEAFSNDPSKASYIKQLVLQGRIVERRMFRLTYISIAGVLCVFAYFCTSVYQKIHLNRSNCVQLPSDIAMAALVASIISTSWSVVPGIDIEPKVFIDNGAGFWGSIAITFILIDIYKLRPSETRTLILIVAFIACTFSTYVYGRMAVVNYSYSQRASRHKSETLSTNTLNVVAENIFWGSAASSMSRARQKPFLGSYQYPYEFYGKNIKDEILLRHYLAIACLNKSGLTEEAEKLKNLTLSIINLSSKELIEKRLKEFDEISNSECGSCDNFLFIPRSKKKF